MPQKIASAAPAARRHPEVHASGGDAVRDLILGMSDGLTTPFALAAGLAGAASSNVLVVIGGLAEIAAGSISMGLGGYLAAKSLADTYHRELARETEETHTMPAEERAEVWRIFRDYGLSGIALEQATSAVTANRDAWVRFMMREELGLEEPAPRAALWSAARIAGAYVVAGMIPLTPYLFPVSLHGALLLSCVVTGAALAVFGAIKGRYTGAAAMRSAVQTVAIGGTAAAVAYAIGRVISRLGV
jgi:VIT1/CCC1 family predicted Fe2+/Mn2+ transporter